MWIENLKYPTNYELILKETLIKNADIKSFETLNKIIPFDIAYIIINGYNNNPQSRAFLKSTNTLDDTICECYIKNNFSKYKQIYLLSEPLRKRLAQTKGLDTISMEILNKLPYDFFYIELDMNNDIVIKNQKLQGFIVSKETFNNDNVAHNNLVLILKLENTYIPLKIKMHETVEQSIKSLWSSEDMSTEEKEKSSKIFHDLLQVVVYMCSIKPDIKKSRRGTQLKSKSKNKSKKEKPIIYNEIGFTIGTTLGATKYVYENNTPIDTISKTNTKKAPHIRKPHWHTYKTGKGRSEISVKWLDAMFINATDENDINITIHKMK